jgi:PPE-repeat protein
MLAAAAGWDGLAAQLHTAAASYGSVVSELTSGPWLGPSSAAMMAAVAPYVAWINATAGQAAQSAAQARAAASAYETAFAMTVPPPVVAANRAQLAALVATNLLGQNSAAIAATEAHYGEMWAQDASAMYGYAANSAAATAVTPFNAAPPTTNAAGPVVQNAASQATGTAGSSLSQLIPTVLNGLASPAAATPSDSGLSGLLSALGLTGSSAGSSTGGLSGLDPGNLFSGLLQDYLYLPGFFGAFAAIDALSPIIGNAETAGPSALVGDDTAGAGDGAENPGEGAAGTGDGAEGATDWAGTGPGSEFAGDLSAAGSLGDAPALGALSVPPSWLWAAAPPLPMLPGGVPLALPDADLGSGFGFPFPIGGLPRGAGIGVAAAAGAAAGKFGSRLKVVARPPAAGYPVAEPAASSTHRYPVPAAGSPTNGHVPPGYRPAIVYVPTNGHEPANV